jgi:hypothetical protein
MITQSLERSSVLHHLWGTSGFIVGGKGHTPAQHGLSDPLIIKIMP